MTDPQLLQALLDNAIDDDIHEEDVIEFIHENGHHSDVPLASVPDQSRVQPRMAARNQFLSFIESQA